MSRKTEFNQKSLEKKAIEAIDLRLLNEFLYEDDGKVKKLRKILDTAYELATTERDVNMIKLFINKVFSDAKQSIDLSSLGEKVQTVQVEVITPKNDIKD